MAEICATCGLPKSICVCETISREQQRVKIKLELRKWNKPTTVIEGLNGSKKRFAGDSFEAKVYSSMRRCGEGRGDSAAGRPSRKSQKSVGGAWAF